VGYKIRKKIRKLAVLTKQSTQDSPDDSFRQYNCCGFSSSLKKKIKKRKRKRKRNSSSKKW
jgi:hypothetical protein